MNDIAQVYPVETSLQLANPRKLMTGEPEIASESQELDVDMFSLLVYPLRSRGKDGHFADAQIVSG